MASVTPTLSDITSFLVSLCEYIPYINISSFNIKWHTYYKSFLLCDIELRILQGQCHGPDAVRIQTINTHDIWAGLAEMIRVPHGKD